MILRLAVLAIVAMLDGGAAVAQEIYHYVDEAGRPVFTDQPPKGREAERLEWLPPHMAADREAAQRLERINETASLLREDREAREARRDALRRDAARRARDEAMAEAAADNVREPRVAIGGWYPAWRPGYGRWPDWHPWHPPNHPPMWRPPHRPERQAPPGGVLRPGPGAKGW